MIARATSGDVAYIGIFNENVGPMPSSGAYNKYNPIHSKRIAT